MQVGWVEKQEEAFTSIEAAAVGAAQSETGFPNGVPRLVTLLRRPAESTGRERILAG